VFSPSELPTWARRLASAGIHSSWEWLCEAGAITTGDRRSRRFGSFGAASAIAFPHGAMFGEEWIRIGTGTIVGPYVTLSAGMVPGQAMYTDPVVSIGDRCSIGRGSHIVGHLSIEIGDDIQFGPYVYVTDQNHGYEELDPIGRQWPVNDPVRIGSGSWLGVGVKVLPGADIGDHVAVAAGSVVRGTFPDHCVIAGVPAKVVRRFREGEGWVSEVPQPSGAAVRPRR
jgi:acetyltransferase-like isoleucine patch superfamily enzyme